MKILWFTWKDLQNPQAGGAEVVNEELAKRLVGDGHEVVLLVGGFAGGQATEVRDGYKIIRLGNRWTVYWQAYRYYRQNLQGWADVAIDEVNTVPFFIKFFVKEKNVLLIHQLCREIWFYQMAFPLNVIGYLLEPLYLRLLRGRPVITISESSKRDFLRYGFQAELIKVLELGIENAPVESLASIDKFTHPTILSLGAIRNMKRTLDIVKAFELAKATSKDLRLVVAGDASTAYGKQVLDYINQSVFTADISYEGRVSPQKKIELMQQAHLIAVTSVKEGWGLIVPEANSQGTPAVVYDVDGLRDSVRHGQTGLVTEYNTPAGLAASLVSLLSDPRRYEEFRQAGWQWSQQLTFANTYQEFLAVITA